MQGKFISHELFADLNAINVFHTEYPQVTVPNATEKYADKHVLFRKKFNAGGDLFKAVLKITADDYFKLYINGEFVTQGPPPSYPQAYYYMELPVGKFLKSGENVIAVHTLYQGLINRVWASGDNRESLWAELVVDGEVILATDESWKCKISSAYEPMAIVGYDTQYMELFDSCSEDVGFEKENFDDSKWQNAKIKKHNDYNLIKSPIKPLEIYEVEPKSVRKTKNGYLYDFGQEAIGYLVVTAKGKKSDEIIIRQGEELNDDGSVRFDLRSNCRYEEKWILSGGEDTLDQFDYKGFRFAELIVPETAEIISVKFRIRHYPFKQKAVYKSINADFDNIIKLCVNTIKYGTQEIIPDCPTREKGSYLGDFCISGRAQALLTGDTTFLKKTILDFCRTSFICKGLMSVATSSFMQEIADYGLIFPSLVLWTYKFDGDIDFLKSVEPTLKGMCEYFASFDRGDGLIEKLYGQWNLVDWPANLRDGYDFPLTKPISDGVHNALNALWIGFLKAMNEIEGICGNEEVAETDEVIRSFYKAFYNDETGLFCDSESKTHSAVHSNIFPLLFGIYGKDEELKKRLVKMIYDKKLNSMGVYMAYFALAALVENGERDKAIELTLDKNAWLNMIKEGATTTFEAWGKEQKWNTSLFHPWAVAPLIVFNESGIKVY